MKFTKTSTLWTGARRKLFKHIVDISLPAKNKNDITKRRVATLCGGYVDDLMACDAINYKRNPRTGRKIAKSCRQYYCPHCLAKFDKIEAMVRGKHLMNEVLAKGV